MDARLILRVVDDFGLSPARADQRLQILAGLCKRGVVRRARHQMDAVAVWREPGIRPERDVARGGFQLTNTPNTEVLQAITGYDFAPRLVEIGQDASLDDLWIHDEQDLYKAQLLVRLFDDPRQEGHFPRPFGVFYQTQRPCYEDIMQEQLAFVQQRKGPGDLDQLLRGNETWTIA